MVKLLYIFAGLVTVSAVFLIAGCEDRYRYACQDPMNHKNPECQHPACEADGTCTDYLITPSEVK